MRIFLLHCSRQAAAIKPEKRDFTGSGNEREDIDSGRRESPFGRVLRARSLQAGHCA